MMTITMTMIADNDVCLSLSIVDIDLGLWGVWHNGNHEIVHKIVNQVAKIVPQEGPFFSIAPSWSGSI
jgi:hypothetical protein